MTEPPEAALIRIRAATVRFGTQEVLRDLSLDIHRGETVAVIGESGCGKTCLLKMIVGLLTPNEGEIEIDGKSLKTMANRDLTALRLRVGYLFQSAALFDSINVFGNIAFGLRAKGGLTENEIADRVRLRLGDVGLSANVETKMPAELSGGMRKRVGLARALAIDPDVMLYDEPTTGLDPIMTETINDLILQARKRRAMTSIVVTHELRTVFKVANRVVMLSPLSRLTDGGTQIIYDGTPAGLKLAVDPKVREFVEGYLTAS